MLGMFEVRLRRLPPRVEGSFIFREIGQKKRLIFLTKYQINGVIDFKARRDPFGIWNGPQDIGLLSINGGIEAPLIKNFGKFSLNFSNIDFLIEEDPLKFIRKVKGLPTFIDAVVNASAKPSSSSDNSGTARGHLVGYVRLCTEIVTYNGPFTIKDLKDILRRVGVL